LLFLLLTRCLAAESQEAILITGGSVSGAETFQPFSSSELLLSTCSVAPLPKVNYDHVTLTMADGAILSCGGTFNYCLQLPSDLNSWTYHSSLPSSFTYSNIISSVLPSGAYLMGRNTGAFLATGSNNWQAFHIPADHDARSACSVPVTSTSFLLIGGFWEQGDFVDEYESLTGEWTRWPAMPEKRENMACARLGSVVLISGGYNRALNTNDGATVILDIETKRWGRGGDMTWERMDHSVSVLGSGRVLAYGGGYYGDDGVEEWNMDSETWSPIEEKLDIPRSSFGSSVVSVIC